MLPSGSTVSTMIARVESSSSMTVLSSGCVAVRNGGEWTHSFTVVGTTLSQQEASLSLRQAKSETVSDILTAIRKAGPKYLPPSVLVMSLDASSRWWFVLTPVEFDECNKHSPFLVQLSSNQPHERGDLELTVPLHTLRHTLFEARCYQEDFSDLREKVTNRDAFMTALEAAVNEANLLMHRTQGQSTALVAHSPNYPSNLTVPLALTEGDRLVENMLQDTEFETQPEMRPSTPERDPGECSIPPHYAYPAQEPVEWAIPPPTAPQGGPTLSGLPDNQVRSQQLQI